MAPQRGDLITAVPTPAKFGAQGVNFRQNIAEGEMPHWQWAGHKRYFAMSHWFQCQPHQDTIQRRN